MIVRRIAANVIDILVLLFGTALGTFLGGELIGMFEEPFALLTWSMVCVIILVPILIQSLFWIDGTTLGKFMLFCEVKNKEGEKPDYFQMFAREYLAKVLTCYIGTLPVFFGKPGVHEVGTESKTVLKPLRKQGNKS